MKEIGPLKKVTNLHAAASHIKRRYFVPIDIEIPNQAETSECKIHGYNVLRISQLFAKLCSILKITPEDIKVNHSHLCSALEVNPKIFDPCSTSCEDPTDADVTVWKGNTRKVSSKNLIFMWGFRNGMSASMLKDKLHGSNKVFSEEFDVRLVDKSSAVVVFWNTGSSESFLEAMDSGGTCSESVREIISEGMRAAGYEAYERVCRLGLWEADLADSLDKALADSDSLSEAHSTVPSDIYWDSDLMINLDDL